MGATAALVGRPSPSVEPQFFGLLPAGAWADPHLSWCAKLVLGALVILARGKDQINASNAEIQRAGAMSARSVQRGIGELEDRGYLTRESIGARFVLLFVLRRGEKAVIPITASPARDVPPDAPPTPDETPPHA